MQSRQKNFIDKNDLAFYEKLLNCKTLKFLSQLGGMSDLNMKLMSVMGWIQREQLATYGLRRNILYVQCSASTVVRDTNC